VNGHSIQVWAPVSLNIFNISSHQSQLTRAPLTPHGHFVRYLMTLHQLQSLFSFELCDILTEKGEHKKLMRKWS